MAMSFRFAWSLPLAAALVACEAVPSLTFSHANEQNGALEDAAADAEGGASSAGAADGAGPDAGASPDANADASDGGASADASDGGALCATPNTYCCPNGEACLGAKCPVRCVDCSVCGPTRYCCAPNGNGLPVTCSATPTCP